MMKYGIKFKQGDILILPFPFTDLSSVKQRPVLVISNDSYNDTTEDLIICGITSNPKNTIYSVSIDQKDLAEGRIPIASRIKIDKIFTLKQSLAKMKVARVKQNILGEVKKEIAKIFQI